MNSSESGRAGLGVFPGHLCVRVCIVAVVASRANGKREDGEKSVD